MTGWCAPGAVRWPRSIVAAIVGITALLVATSDDGSGGTASDGGASDAAPLSTASWLDQVLLRLAHMDVFRIELILIVPSATVLFLVGSRLVRAGLFTTTEDGARLRRRLAWVGLGAGIPLNALTTWAGPDWFLVDRYLVPPLVALGILALGTTLVARAQARAQARGLTQRAEPEPGRPAPPGRRGGRADGAVVLRAAERARLGALLRLGAGARRRRTVAGGRDLGRRLARR